MNGATLAFWLAFGLVAYTYIGYPIGIWLAARTRKEQAPDAVADWPAVTLVVAAHNEAARIDAKVANLRNLDYPAGRLRLLFVSDGSTDGTDTALASITDVESICYPVRRGKPHALNLAMQRVETPIVVFSDVRQMIEPQAIRHLVARLLQPGVGAVSGALVHVAPGTQTAAQIGLYWRYEKWIRRSESRFASTVGATGALYAIRSRDFTPLRDDTLLDDFEIPMQVVRRGLRTLFEPRAVLYDELQPDIAGERKRKIRTLTGNFQSFARNPWMFVPWRNPVFVQFVSHKVLRLLVPYAMLAMLLASLLADGAFYAAAAVAQFAFYATALLGARVPGLRSNRVVSFVTVFVELNWAAVMALAGFVSSRSDAKWEKT